MDAAYTKGSNLQNYNLTLGNIMYSVHNIIISFDLKISEHLSKGLSQKQLNMDWIVVAWLGPIVIVYKIFNI